MSAKRVRLPWRVEATWPDDSVSVVAAFALQDGAYSYARGLSRDLRHALIEVRHRGLVVIAYERGQYKSGSTPPSEVVHHDC